MFLASLSTHSQDSDYCSRSPTSSCSTAVKSQDQDEQQQIDAEAKSSQAKHIDDVDAKLCSEFHESAEWYKGFKLDVSWLLKTYQCLEKIKLGNRNGIKCQLCWKHITEAQKYSKNGRVPIADGVRCEGKERLERIIDHLKSEVHLAASRLDCMQEKWMANSSQHPWIKTLVSHNAEKVKFLIELAVDVYNDSKVLTLSAHSWPSRSVSRIHA